MIMIVRSILIICPTSLFKLASWSNCNCHLENPISNLKTFSRCLILIKLKTCLNRHFFPANNLPTTNIVFRQDLLKRVLCSYLYCFLSSNLLTVRSLIEVVVITMSHCVQHDLCQRHLPLDILTKHLAANFFLYVLFRLHWLFF